MTKSQAAILRVIDILNESGAQYLVTGSLASSVYRTSRSTKDADFVVHMSSDQLQNFFKRLSADFEHLAQMSFETVTGKLQHRFRVPGSEFLIEIFEARMNDPHERARFERARPGMVEGRTAPIPSAEDVLVQKLRWFHQIRRSKDRDDILEIMVHQWEGLDWPYIEKWCREHGSFNWLEQLRDQARSFINEKMK